jgi:hypothetical protein
MFSLTVPVDWLLPKELSSELRSTPARLSDVLLESSLLNLIIGGTLRAPWGGHVDALSLIFRLTDEGP